MGKYTSRYSGPQIDAAVEKAHKTGPTDPTIYTVGVLGQRYFNTVTGVTFECVNIETVDDVTTFTWRPIIANSLDVETPGQALDATQGKALAALIDAIKGVGWTTETLKGLADLISTHTAKTIANTTAVTRDISVTGTQTITLPFKAKSIHINAFVAGTQKSSWGLCGESESNQNCMHMLPGGFISGDSGYMVRIYTDASNYATGTVTAISDTSITITWTKTGSPTGTAILFVNATTH